MYQIIHETIAVAGVFRQGKFKPRKFLWRNREYTISEITLASDVKDGGVRQRWYSVMANNNLYRLCFNREDELWVLEEVWVE